MAAPRSLRPYPCLSGFCLAYGGASFLAGWIMAAIAAPDLAEFFYEPRVLAVTHIFTLNWISMVMIGVLYEYVPALTEKPLPRPRLAAVQAVVFALGSNGMVAHFWTGRMLGMEWSAELVFASVLLFSALTLPSLLRAPRFDATVIGITAAVVYFAGTATVGLLYAVDKVHPFLGGGVLSNIAAHAHLGLLGWITLAICAVSYRTVAAFVLPTQIVPEAARRQIVFLAVLVPALFVSLIAQSPLARVFGVLVAVAMGWYAGIVWRLLRTRRLPIDWSAAHVLAALAHLAAAIACGLALLFAVDPGSALGSRLVVAYGVLALVGWISNLFAGVGSRMAPGILGRGPKPLLSGAWRAAAFVLLNGGIAAVVAAVLAGTVQTIRVAMLLPLAAGAVFAVAVLRGLRSSATL